MRSWAWMMSWAGIAVGTAMGQGSPSASTTPTRLPAFEPAGAKGGVAVGTMEIVSELDITPGNVTVSRSGRMFASVHGMRRWKEPAQLIEIMPGKNQWKRWPDASWNAAPGSGRDVLNTAHGVAIDGKDRLWVTDHGNWMPGGQDPRQPKLVAFDIETGTLTYRMDFAPEVGPSGGIMQDLAVDAERGFVYIADCGTPPAIVVVDTTSNTARRWTGDPSLRAENVDLIVEGQLMGFPQPDGGRASARVPVNPITLSADGQTLFYKAMNGETLYSVPAKLLREGADEATLAAAVKRVGVAPASDGISTDAEGNHFITNLRDNAIDVLGADGKMFRLFQDERFLWPDNVRFGPDSWLYACVNQLHRNPIFTGKPDNSVPPFLIARIWTGTKGQPGR